MGDKHCPAGEIECLEKDYCEQCFGLHLHYFKVCPWDDRQRPVKGEALPDMTIQTELGEMTLHCADRNEIECPVKGEADNYNSDEAIDNRNKNKITEWKNSIKEHDDKIFNSGIDAAIRAVENTIEKLSDLEHKRWAKWQKYLHSKCIKKSDNSLLIPVKMVDHWENQIYTNYEDLSDHEKESDKSEARKNIQIIISAISALKKGRV